MHRSTAKILSIVALATFTTASASWGDDAFPLVGTSTKPALQGRRVADADVARVKITLTEMNSSLGLCTILENKRHGNTFAVHVECKGPDGSPMLGDVNFTLRDDHTIDFSDQDQTYKAVPHKCP